MISIRSRPKSRRAGSAIVVLAFIAASCGAVVQGGEGKTAAGESTKSLPDKLVVAIGDYKKPTYFLNDQDELVGLNVDLARALGKRLGIKIAFATVPFESVLAGIQAGRYDTAVYNMSDKPERRQVVDFVDYAISGTVVVTRKGDREGITTDPLSLCGKDIALKSGQYEYQLLQDKVNPKCVSAGKEKINLQTFKDDSSQHFAVRSGRSDAFVGGFTVTPYFVSQNSDTFELVGKLPIGAHPLGMPFDKGRSALVKAFLDAWKWLYKSGKYADLAAKWSLDPLVPEDISFFRINGGKGLTEG